MSSPGFLAGSASVGSRLAAAGTTQGQLLGAEPGPARPAGPAASPAVLEVAEIFSAPTPTPTPSRPAAHRNFQTCSLRLPQGGAMTGLLTLCSSDCPFKKEKEKVYRSQRAFCLSFLILMAALSWKILSCIPSGPQARRTSGRSCSALFQGLVVPPSSSHPLPPARPGPEHPSLSELLSGARRRRRRRKAEMCGMVRRVLKFL